MPRHSLQAHLQVPEVGEVANALRYGALEVVIAKVSAHLNAGHCMRINQGSGTGPSAINPMVAPGGLQMRKTSYGWLAGWLDVLASYGRRLPQAINHCRTINSHNHDMLISIAPFSPLFGWMPTAMARQMLSIGPWMLWWWTRSSQGTMDLDSSRVAAAGAEQARITHYANALPRHENVVLQPLALETMGAMGERFQEILCNCAKNRRHYMRGSENDMTRIIQAMAQRISIALMTAQFHVTHGRARRQQPVLTMPFRTTIHTASDLNSIGRD